MKIAFQMERLAAANPLKSTSYALLQTAVGRGYQVFLYPAEGLTRHSAGVRVFAWPVFASDAGLVEGDAEEIELKALDVVLVRQDPPYDMGYLTACHHLMAIADGVMVLNHPQALIQFPEKIAPLLFPHLTPETIITSSWQELLVAARHYGEVIAKPLYAFGGESVFRFHKDDSNLRPTAELLFARYQLPFIVQPYLPDVRDGDKRILLIQGKIAGAFRRVPAEGQHRANLAAGGELAAVQLSKRDHEICETLAPWLRQHGLFLAGIDVIGDYLTEINITSPMGIVQIKKLGGMDAAALFWDEVETALQ